MGPVSPSITLITKGSDPIGLASEAALHGPHSRPFAVTIRGRFFARVQQGAQNRDSNSPWRRYRAHRDR